MTSINEKIETYHHPFMVYDKEIVLQQCHKLKSFLKQSSPNSSIFYALKSCYFTPLIKLLLKQDLGLEVVSSHEKNIANSVECPSSRVIWNGPYLSKQDLEGIICRRELINIDSSSIWKYAEEFAYKSSQLAKVGVRVNISDNSKLGMKIEEIERLLSQKSNLTVIGFHFHSSPRTKKDIKKKIRRTVNILKKLKKVEEKFKLNLEYIDIGGGLHCAFDLSFQLSPLINHINKFASSPKLLCEPGAYLSERSGSVFTQIVSIKKRKSRVFAIVDAGPNILVPTGRANFKAEKINFTKPNTIYTIVGSSCMESDFIDETLLSQCKVGDVLKISNCGAYTLSMSSNFIHRPPIVFWKNNNLLTHFI